MRSNLMCWCALALSMMAMPAQAEWLTSFEAAQKKAAADKKDIYLVFTGSDWCEACQGLEKRVLSQPSFQKGAEERFVLLRIDLPLRKNIPQEVKKRRQALADQFRVTIYPTAFYLDVEGRPFARDAGALPHGPERYAGHLLSQSTKRVKRDQALAQAARLPGMDRARAIVAALQDLPAGAVSQFYPEQVKVLEKLDPEDSLNFLKGRRSQAALLDFERSLKSLFNKNSFDQVIANVDDYLLEHDPSGETRQKALSYKMSALSRSSRVDEALKVADEILALGKTTQIGRFVQSEKVKLLKRKIAGH